MEVYKILGRPEPKAGDVGIEIEVEGHEPLPPAPRNSCWVSKEEGSLRYHGREYITNEPQVLNDALLASLTDLSKHLNKKDIVIENSPRTSVHIHVNVTDLHMTQMWTGACAFWLVENMLLEYCGPERVSNLFCLRIQDAEGVLKYVQRDLNSDRPLVNHLNTDQVRYAALNLNAASKFGSLEVRCMRGTTDPVLIYTWSKLVHRIIHEAHKKHNNPADLMDYYFRTPRLDFLNSVVGEDDAKTLIKCCGRKWEDLIEDNVGSVLSIAYHHNWEKYEKRLDEMKKGAVPKKANVNVVNGNIINRVNDFVAVAGGGGPIQGRAVDQIIIDDVMGDNAQPIDPAVWAQDALNMEAMRRAARAMRANPVPQPQAVAVEEDF